MGNIGIPELLLIIFLVLLLFGAHRIPELGASLGKALSEFRKAQKGPDDKTDNPQDKT